MSDIIPSEDLINDALERRNDAYLGLRVRTLLERMAIRIGSLTVENKILVESANQYSIAVKELESILADVSQDDGFRAGYKLAVKEAVAVANIILSEKVDGGERAAIIETIGAIKGACNK